MKIFCLHYAVVCVCWCMSAVSACERTSKRVPFALCLHISVAFCHCCWLLFLRPFTARNISQISVWVCIKVARRSRRHRRGAQYLLILFASSLSASSSLMSNARNIYLQFLNRSYANTCNIRCEGKTRWDTQSERERARAARCLHIQILLLSFVRHVIWQLLKICTKLL